MVSRKTSLRPLRPLSLSKLLPHPLSLSGLRKRRYAPYGNLVSDMFWFLPRTIAQRVLTTWSDVVVPCSPGERCCNLTLSPAVRRSSPVGMSRDQHSERAMKHPVAHYDIRDDERAPYSNWLRIYCDREGLRPDYVSLRGYGLVAANPNKRARK
jgi:hypothetical protein